MPEGEIVEARDRAAWRRWLRRHHDRGSGAWLAIAKKGGSVPAPGYEDAVLEALCFGWIDSTTRRLDDDRSLIWMAPRQPRSNWSASNKARVEVLLRDGLMQAPGLAAIELAKANGSWEAYERSDRLEIPKELAAAFRKHPGSRKHWNAFPPSVRKQILWWINSAKRDETRTKRVTETASLAARNERANQSRPKE